MSATIVDAQKDQAMKIASLAFALLMGAVIMSALCPLWLAGG